MSKIIQTVKTNFNDRHDEVRFTIQVSLTSLKLDPQTLGRWYHGFKIPCPRCEVGKSQGKGNEDQAWLTAIKEYFYGRILLF